MGFMTSQTGWRSYGPTLPPPSDAPAGLLIQMPAPCPSPPGMGALADTTVSLQTLLYAALAGGGIWAYFKITAAAEKAKRRARSAALKQLNQEYEATKKEIGERYPTKKKK